MRLRVIYLIVFIITGCSTPDPPDKSSQDTTSTTEQRITNPQTDRNSAGQNRSTNYNSGTGSVLSIFFLGGLFFVVGGSIFWLYKKTEELSSKIARVSSDMRDVSHKMGGVYRLKEKLNKIDSRLYKLEENVNAKLANYKSYIDKSVDELSNDTKSTTRNISSKNQDIQGYDYSVLKKADNPERSRKEKNKSQITPQDRNTKTLYFSGPEDSGKFTHKKGDIEPSEKKIFSISYYPRESTGQLDYLSSNYDGQVINYKDTMLRPVCDIVESDEGSFTKVKMKSPGKVRREGEYWVIEEKIEIEIL